MTEKYVNGTEWYNLYSDGWCEQGGVLSNRTEEIKTFNLLKPYNNTNYTGKAGICSSGAMNNGYQNCIYGICGLAPISGSQACVRTVNWSDTSWETTGYTSITSIQYLEFYLN